MYKYVLNLVIKISLMFAQYFEYYAIMLRGPFFCGHSVDVPYNEQLVLLNHNKCNSASMT